MSYLAEERRVEPVVVPGLGREISPVGDLGSLIALRRIIAEFRPRIIHTHTAKAGSLGRLSAISLNLSRKSTHRIKLVHTFHGHIFHSYFGLLKTFSFIQIEKFLSRFTDRIVCISPRQRDDICVRFKIAKMDKVSVIPLGFDLSKFRTPYGSKRKEIREKYLQPDAQETLLVGTIGRLTHIKNHRMLLEAVKCLRDFGKNRFFQFLIVGDGELRNDLAEHAAQLGVQDAVTFTGWQKDMPSMYSAMDMVVLTSMNEGTPVALIEAMAAGIPVVATDVGGVRDLLGAVIEKSVDGYKLAQNGILVPSGEGKTLAKALLFLLENKGVSQEMVKRGKEFVLNRYTTERLVKDIETLYSDLLEE
jgi:glycosyltransferase involved in cell wall biosynthesis